MEDDVRTDARYSAQQIGKLIGISKGSSFNILRNVQNMN